jgi:thiol-disulfide isomerase/thioredoxin
MRRLIIVLAAITLFLGALNFVSAESDKVNIYFFWGDGCPHCAKEEIFLGKIKEMYPGVEIRDFEVWKNRDNAKLLAEFGKRLNVSVSGVPFTVIGDKYFVGYLNDETTGKDIEETVKEALRRGCQDIGSQILGDSSEKNGQSCAEEKKGIPSSVKIPVFGEINIKKMSLPTLTAVFGLLDGFNPCSMWALIFLISILLSMGSKRRLLILGSAFILISAFSYFLFMSAWLNLFLFLGFVVWVRIIIGIVAIGSSYYNLKEYFTNKDTACKVAQSKTSKNIIGKLKDAVREHNILVALVGIGLLAFAVNMVELICSAGFPAIYTQVLSLSDLPSWKYYAYIALYVFFYDLDEIVVLVAALVTFKITTTSHRYVRWSHLIGGILMLILGLLLIFKHEWLMFG